MLHALGWTEVSFLPDCKVLAEAVEANDLLAKPGHWRLIPANFCHVASSLNSFKISHIPRTLNLVAHSLAKRACRHRSTSSVVVSDAVKLHVKLKCLLKP